MKTVLATLGISALLGVLAVAFRPGQGRKNKDDHPASANGPR